MASTSAAVPKKDDPILRNALRYTISAREYAALHKYILSRSRLLRKRAPSVETVSRIMNGDSRDAANQATTATVGPADDFNARAVRHSIRVFVATSVASSLWAAVLRRLSGTHRQDSGGTPPGQKRTPLYKSPTFRLSLSLSTILLLYRILFRFLTRLRAHLLDPSALPFRRRNPRAAAALTSPYTPAVGASLAGLALGIYPARHPLRMSMAVFALFRALEFGWNAAEGAGAIWGVDETGRPRARPSWWGLWMVQPFALGQLLHATVFDRDCAPRPIYDRIFDWSTAYLQPRPEGAAVAWPGRYDVVDALASMAKANWP